MSTFQAIQNNKNIQELIKSTFDVDLDISGSWGYTKEDATVIRSLPEGMLLSQLQHMLSTIRAHLEMNITQAAANRYGGINSNESSRDVSKETTAIYNEVQYEITAIKENLYNAIIKEYKEGYGKEEFDLNEHFRRRKEATLTRETIHYFEVSNIK
jgi:hypothetical protein